MRASGDDKVKESTIQQAILRWLRARPDSFTVKLAAGPYTVPGLPDILHVEKGRPFFLEVKRPDGRATPLQVAMIEQLVRAGAVAAVVRSVEDAQAAVEGWR